MLKNLKVIDEDYDKNEISIMSKNGSTGCYKNKINKLHNNIYTLFHSILACNSRSFKEFNKLFY